MRWSDLFSWFRPLGSVRCEMNGLFYTSIFYRIECGGFHVPRAVVCEWFYLGYIAISLRCSTLSGRLVSLAATQFFVISPLCAE